MKTKIFKSLSVLLSLIFISGCTEMFIYKSSTKSELEIENAVKVNDRVKVVLLNNSVIRIKKVSAIQDGLIIGNTWSGKIARIEISNINKIVVYRYSKKKTLAAAVLYPVFLGIWIIINL